MSRVLTDQVRGRGILEMEVKNKRRENRNGEDQESDLSPSYLEYMLQQRERM